MSFCSDPKLLHYQTPVMQIGTHEWRLIVIDCYYGGRSTVYQWRDVGNQHWIDYREWPTFNANDGDTSGLPKTLKKLYALHQFEIENACNQV